MQDFKHLHSKEKYLLLAIRSKNFYVLNFYPFEVLMPFPKYVINQLVEPLVDEFDKNKKDYKNANQKPCSSKVSDLIILVIIRRKTPFYGGYVFFSYLRLTFVQKIRICLRDASNHLLTM